MDEKSKRGSNARAREDSEKEADDEMENAGTVERHVPEVGAEVELVTDSEYIENYVAESREILQMFQVACEEDDWR